ncbi:hypothetical protein E2320_001754 [Naja naja]|nr:hypothetical protein E2320_001754 [Naja naja]
MPTLFLFLNLLFLIQPVFQISDSDTFMMYNENLDLCLKLQESRSFTFDICNKFNEWQNFKWVSDYQLLNMAVKLCLSVPSKSNMVPVTLSPCNETIELQKWECRNDTLFALAKQDLFLNPANGHENGVILSENLSTKSVWKIYETKKSLCDQKYEDEKDDFFWVKNHWTGDLYQINSLSALTWDEARKSCWQQNSELLSINELYEQAYLTGLTNNFDANYWIGLNNPDFDSGWQWSNEQPLRYLNWAPGSPSSETGKNCALLQGRNGKWANNLCEQKCGYICKRVNSSVQAPGPSSDDLKPIKCPGDWVGYAKHCYHLNRDGKTWKDASVSCQKDGGHLLSIHDIEEYSFVFSQLGYKPTDNLWIGLNDQKTFSYFEWSDGSTVRFIRWQKGEPTLISNVQEDCVIMSGKAYKKKKAERKSWYEAYDFCKSIGGDLASFNSKPEEHLLNQLSETEEGWIDLRFWNTNLKLSWIDGSLLQLEDAKVKCLIMQFMHYVCEYTVTAIGPIGTI